jgi:hypothetical protein
MRPGDTVIIRGTNHAWSNRQGFGNVICWRLYGGEAPGQITEMVITNSRTGGGRELTRQQAEAAVGFAISDLCPDAAPD